MDSPPGILLGARSGATFRFDPGALCLELLTTGGPGEFRHFEVLHSPADLASWAARSRLTPTPALTITDADVTQARHLRDALFRITTKNPEPDDLATLNAAAANPALVPAIAQDGTRHWAGTPTGTQLLATVARDAIDLLTGPFSHRVRTCAADNCSLVYVDTSRPGRRRWCSMDRCGNRHKVRTLRARRDSPSE